MGVIKWLQTGRHPWADRPEDYVPVFKLTDGRIVRGDALPDDIQPGTQGELFGWIDTWRGAPNGSA